MCTELHHKLNDLFNQAKFHLRFLCKMAKPKDCAICIDYNSEIITAQALIKKHENEDHNLSKLN
jgi:hypothetical protein